MISRRTLLTRARYGVRWLLREGPWFGFSPIPLLLHPELIDVDSEEHNPLVMADTRPWDGPDTERFYSTLDVLYQFHTVNLPCGNPMRVRITDPNWFAETYGFTLWEPNTLWQRIAHAGSEKDSRALSDAWRQAISEGAIVSDRPIEANDHLMYTQIVVNPAAFGDAT